MKFAIATLLTTSASAKWGTWDETNYCNFNQDSVAETSAITSQS